MTNNKRRKKKNPKKPELFAFDALWLFKDWVGGVKGGGWGGGVN